MKGRKGYPIMIYVVIPKNREVKMNYMGFPDLAANVNLTSSNHTGFECEIDSVYNLILNLQNQIDNYEIRMDCHGHDITQIWQQLVSLTIRINIEGAQSRQAWIQSMKMIKESFKEVNESFKEVVATNAATNARLVVELDNFRKEVEEMLKNYQPERVTSSRNNA